MRKYPAATAKHYVYVHTRNDTGGVFYVGKGTECDSLGGQQRLRRAGAGDRNIWWRRIVRKSGGFTAHKIGEFESEAEALWAERAMIKYFGRKGEGPLVNLTDGGEVGPSGYRHTAEAKERIGAATRLRIRRPVGTASRARMSAVARLAQKDQPNRGVEVVSVIDGRIWPSIRRAAAAIGVKCRTLNAALVGGMVINRWGVRRKKKV